MKKLGEDLPKKNNNQNIDLFIESNDELLMLIITEDFFGLNNKNKKEEK